MEKQLFAILAKPMKRYIACTIDGLLFGIVVLPTMIYTMNNTFFDDQQYIVIVLLFSYKVFVYLFIDFLIPYLHRGKTIGRSVMHIRLVQKNGQLPTTRNYVLRTSIFMIIAVITDLLDLPVLAYAIWVGIFVISITLLYVHEYRMTIHDHLAQTMVVEDAEEYIMEMNT